MAKKANKTTTKKVTPKKVEEPVAEKQPKYGEEGIDVVVPMVFPNGETWLRNYRDACAKTGREATIGERFRSWDLERYFFRGIEKFMPFVRKIHLILADEGQIPFWLDRSKVHIVLHKDIMPEEMLPTFNSLSIEMWLHNIEGLSETFIYCNDDMIATAPLKAEDFFIDGKPVTRCNLKRVDIVGIFLQAVRNCLDMAAKDHNTAFEKDVVLRDGHSYAPMLLSVVRETVERHCGEMRESCSTFREGKNLGQFLYTYEQWLGGKCVNGSHSHAYFCISSDYDQMKKMLLSGTVGVSCFNDAGIGDWREMRSVLFNVMQKILGEKCGYEL